MYLQHFSLVTVLQNARIPSMSSCFTFGLTSRRMYSFSSCQRFSMGFKSGDSGGVLHQFIPLASIQAPACLDVCFRSLSIISLWPSGKSELMDGQCRTHDIHKQLLPHNSFKNTNCSPSPLAYSSPHVHFCGMFWSENNVYMYMLNGLHTCTWA